jgi:RNA polymerase sigma-70 factor (ECF subfamily)
VTSSSDSRSDDDLIRAFRTGDGSAMEALFGRYRRSVFGWLLRMSQDEGEAEDLHQEVWLKVIRGIDGYSAGSFRAWLWRVVRNAAADRARKHVAEPILDAPVEEGADAAAFVDQVPDETVVSVLTRMEEEERRAAVREAVDGLSRRLKEVVLLRLNGELKFQEIADILGLPIGTVLGRMNLALAKLRQALSQKGVA